MSEAEAPIRKRAKLPKKTGRNSIKTKDPIVAELFRRAIKSGMTIDQIATRLGCSLQAVSNWKQGTRSPYSVNLQNLAEVIGYRLKLERIQ